jgi:hypothetical protein
VLVRESRSVVRSVPGASHHRETTAINGINGNAPRHVAHIRTSNTIRLQLACVFISSCGDRVRLGGKREGMQHCASQISP